MRGHPGGWRPWRGVLAGALLLASGCVIGGPPTPEPPPNIVIFLADDLGIGEVGAWGQREIATPNIDRLAREGVRLTEFRSGAAVCGPARCTLMTGYHNGHCRLDDNDNGNRPRRSNALGSGFVISEDGYVVTNNHVIDGADEISIEFFSGEELPAEVVGTDPNTDIALLKVKTNAPLPFVSFGDSDNARVGDWVMAMGNPLGQGFSVSAGIVSARNRALSGTYDD